MRGTAVPAYMLPPCRPLEGRGCMSFLEEIIAQPRATTEGVLQHCASVVLKLGLGHVP